MQRTLLFRVSTCCLPKDDRSSAISVFVMFALLTLAVLPALAKGTPAARPVPPQTAQAAPSPLIPTMEQEIEREMSFLGKADPPAYYLGYTLTDSDHAEVVGSNGALLTSQQVHNRWLEAQLHVGTFDLDNTHQIGNGPPASPGSYGESVPIEDDAGVILRAMWRQTDAQYRAAAEALIKVRTSKDVAVQTAEEHAPDFSQEKPNVFYGPHASFTLDRRPWEEKARLYTRFFHASPAILNSIVTFTAQADNQYQVTSEGTRLQFGQVRYRLELFIQGKAADGMDIERYYNFDWADPAAAPDDKTVLAQCAALQKELEGLCEGASGRALCRACDANRSRGRRLLSRSVRPP